MATFAGFLGVALKGGSDAHSPYTYHIEQSARDILGSDLGVNRHCVLST